MLCVFYYKYYELFGIDIIIAQTNCTLFTNETYKKTFFRSI